MCLHRMFPIEIQGVTASCSVVLWSILRTLVLPHLCSLAMVRTGEHTIKEGGSFLLAVLACLSAFLEGL